MEEPVIDNELLLEDENMAEGGDEEGLDSLRARVKEMAEEAEKLKKLQSEVDKSSSHLSEQEKKEIDQRSIYVGNVDYGATAEELEQHFHGCGSVNRVTILCDKFTGHPKGFAYIEFADKDSVETAMALDESLFRGRQIKVLQKRTNMPGISTTNRPPRGRGFRGRGGFRGGFRGAPRRGVFRGRGSRGGFHAGYAPY
ncbi:polyadenylate-binding protein 2-B-like [Varroa jacobsoni]|uniref:RRM domain-containing protein n=1 Tax=Varroa destructor TaxID=109461 RepID=A0A7M7IYM5_VARDE|nr:polyadenylate-binding protein 2-B-like [Varroa destructor]XP_022695798.1 polyadenylate-binding protein 2-B-like [Varroa jacobsoni]